MAIIKYFSIQNLHPSSSFNPSPFIKGGVRGRFYSIIIFLFFVFCNLLFPSFAAASAFKMSPSSGTFNQGCTSSLDIILESQGTTTNAADVIIEYDPAAIDIIDSSVGETGTQITPGTVYTDFFGNVVNTTTGVIRLTGASFASYFTSTGTFGTIQFRPRLATGSSYFNIRFTGADPYNTQDSNIADAYTSNDTLTEIQNATLSFATGSCITDTTPPTITFQSPTNGQTGVASTSNIQLQISDAGSGVNISSVRVVINGVSYQAGDSQFSYTGSSSLYTIIVDPTDPLYTNQTNTLNVTAADLAGNSTTQAITFNTPSTSPTSTPTSIPTPTTTPTFGPSPTARPTSIYCGTAITPAACPTCATCSIPTPTPKVTLTPQEDHNSPTIEFVKPQNKDSIDIDPIINFIVRDSDSGIDINTLKLNLNDTVYTIDLPDFSYSGNPNEYSITLKPQKKLNPGENYLLTVFVADQNKNGISQSIYIITKTPLAQRISNTLRNLFSPTITYQNATKTTSPNYIGYVLLLLLLFLVGLSLYLYRLLHQSYLQKMSPLGQVFNSTTKEPIPHLKVHILNSDRQRLATAITNVFGIFATNLPSAKYYYLIEHQEYIFPSKIDSQDQNYPDYYHSQLVSSTDYQLIPVDYIPPQDLKNASQYGTVTKLGAPVKNLTITLHDLRFNQIVARRVTDNFGRYRFVVPHGHYEVKYGHLHLSNPIIIDTRHLVDGYTTINRDLHL